MKNVKTEIQKMNLAQLNELSDRSYRVPMSMLEAA